MSMARIPFTLRIESEERAALENLSKVEKRPVNQLVNEAIKLYLSRPRGKEKGLQATLEKLEEYRKRDPGFKRAIAAVAEAESKLIDDPAEGEPGEFVDGKFQPLGTVRSKIRERLRA
jgi:hypothetical protein